MKYIVLLCDGMSDYPLDELGGMTPMEAAHKPNMDKIAQNSVIGLVKTVADNMSPGSDVANLSVLGYNPEECYTGRSPLEASSIGIDMKDGDLALRCNLITLSEGGGFGEKTLVDYCAGDISTADAEILVSFLAENLDDDEFRLYSGVSYRHCLIWNGGAEFAGGLGKLIPPHDIIGKNISGYLPDYKLPAAEKLLNIMKKSFDLLNGHPLNLEREKRGLNKANCAWLWGEGKKASLDSFKERFGVTGAMISAVDLLKGIGKLAGMDVISVDGATGYIDTNFRGKAEAAVNALKSGKDFAFIHIEAPDECGHRGEVGNKIKAIEIIDKEILGYILSELDKSGGYRIMILPDHATPLSLRTHVKDPVPFLIYENGVNKDGKTVFSEKTAAETGVFIEKGHELMKMFLS